MAGKLGIKQYETISDVNAYFRSKDGFDVVIEKCKDHPNIKMISENFHLKYVLVLKLNTVI